MNRHRISAEAESGKPCAPAVARRYRGAFGQHAHEYMERGLTVFPCDPEAKRPMVKGWNKVKSTPLGWLDQFDHAQGIGLRLGEDSGITEIDVDAAGDRPLADAFDRFGETPVAIRTASGKSKLWYRHGGEPRLVRPIAGLAVDLLGEGQTIAPPSERDGRRYEFIEGGLDDLVDLPPIRADALDGVGHQRAAETIRRGERNVALWRWCMAEARHCDDVEALLDAALTWNGDMPDPLPRAEVERCARSAWQHEYQDRNFVGRRRPQAGDDDRMMDALIDAPDALVLLLYLRRWHRNRESFAIAPAAMAKAGQTGAQGTLPWSKQRIEKARDVLLARSFLIEKRRGQRGREPGLYAFGAAMKGR